MIIYKMLTNICFITIILTALSCSIVQNTSQSTGNNINEQKTNFMPFVTFITVDGEVSTNDLLANDRAELFLFVASYWGTCRSELRNLKQTNPRLEDFVDVYIVGIDPTDSMDSLIAMYDPDPRWIYAMPGPNTLANLFITSQSTKILVDSDNRILKKYGFGRGNPAEWAAVFKN